MKNKLIASFLGIFFAINAKAQQYSIDIPNYTNFYTTQRQTNWCWAACNQMLLNAIGVNEIQENQVKKIFGQLVNKGAGANYELAKVALAGTYTNSNGEKVTVTAYVSYLYQQNQNDPIVIINKLSKGIPLVMATQQHGRVCIGVDYIQNGQFYQITTLRLLNPLNPNNVETKSMQQFLSEGLMGFMTIASN